MEVEVKLRLGSQADRQKTAQLLAASQLATYAQENFFFDGSNQELSSRRVVARVRFYNTDEKATLTVKGKAVVQNGISTVAEEEHEIPPAQGRAIVQQPDKLLEVDSQLVQKIKGVYGLQHMVGLGGFKNVRQVFAWEGHKLELDETQFEWGTVYEIELETERPEELRNKLEDFCKANGIAYQQATVTKFQNFINKSLL